MAKHEGKFDRRSFDGSYLRVAAGRIEQCECKACRESRRASIHQHIAREVSRNA